MNRKKVKRTMTIIFSCFVIVLAGVFVFLLLVSGIFEKSEYLEPWQKAYSQKFNDPRIRLTAHGLLSSNGHNMQPWKIRLDKNNREVFYLYADNERLTSAVDPFARQMMITQGTFLEYVNVAGDELGYKTTMDLFPEGGYNEKELLKSMETKPVAKITLTKLSPRSNPLYNFIFLPDTNRMAYMSTKLTFGQINQLKKINTDGGMWIKIFQDKKDMDKLSSYAIQGAVVEANVTDAMKESQTIFRSNEYQKNKYRYGFSVEGQGTSGIMKHLIQGVVTLFPWMNTGKAASDNFIKSTQVSVDNTPAYAMIITKDNSRSSQIKSGMLYSRLILKAHSMGLVMQPLSQVLEEYPEMKELYKSVHQNYAPDGYTIQMLVRLGKASKEVPQSMRKDVMDFVIMK
ncbi:Acg family FMN-binding oxidoreductase [Clostridium sp. LBM24168]